MNNMVSKRAGHGGLALMLLLGLTLWGGTGVPLALASQFIGTATQFLEATQGDTYQFKYTDYENSVEPISPGVTTLNGILDVTTIQAIDPTTHALLSFWVGDGGSDSTQSLTGQFADLTVSSTNSTTDTINFTGGQLALYTVGVNDFNPQNGMANPEADICPGGVCPTPWATANFASGIVPTDSTVTLSSVLTAFTSPFSGKGAGYEDLGATTLFGTGTENGLLNHGGEQTIFGARDMLLGSSLFAPCSSQASANCGSGLNGNIPWQVFSNDPVINPVPEPASVVLVGAGLGALGLWRRMARAPKA